MDFKLSLSSSHFRAEKSSGSELSHLDTGGSFGYWWFLSLDSEICDNEKSPLVSHRYRVNTTS